MNQNQFLYIFDQLSEIRSRIDNESEHADRIDTLLIEVSQYSKEHEKLLLKNKKSEKIDKNINRAKVISEIIENILSIIIDYFSDSS